MPGLTTLSIRNILLLTISTLTLLIIILVGRSFLVQWQQLGRIQSLNEATILGDDLFNTGEKISIERHISLSLLHATDPSTIKALKEKLNESRQKSDMEFQQILPLLESYRSSGLWPKINLIEDKFHQLQALRAEIDRTSFLPLRKRNPEVSERLFQESTDMIMQMQNLWRSFIRDFVDVDPIVNAQMRFKYFLWVAIEYTGRERALIGQLIVENARATPQEQEQLLRWQGTVDYFWSTVHIVADQSRLTPVLGPYLKDAESDYSNIYDMVRDIFFVPGMQQKTPYPINGAFWLELSTGANNTLYALKDIALKETRQYLDKLEMRAEQMIVINALALLLTLLLCLYSFRVVFVRVLFPIKAMVEALISATQGKPAPLPAPLTRTSQDDEIGKLAHVLAVFQKNFEELRRSNQELDDFAYIASHDLKEPLRGLMTQASFLLEDYQDKLDAEAIRRLRRLMYLSQRMEQLIGDLLYFSRLGRTELAVQETNLNDIVRDVCQMMDTFLKEHHAKVTISAPLPRVVCDKLRMTEVFRNLITNAVKYNDKEARTVEVGNLQEMQTSHGHEKNVFYVRDNGIGIAPEFYEAIFRIFKRLENPAVKHEEGTGAGLTFVKKIIERHQGHIWLESEPGKGTTFYFTIGGKAHE